MNKASEGEITVKDSKFGKGLFAIKDISKGNVLFKISGEHLKFEETVILGDKESHSLQIGIDEYLIPDFPFYYSNHSCEPNCGIISDLEMITLREIRAGEELCWDYSTSMLERHWTMKCECGADKCRNVITDFDLLPKTTQNKYLHDRIVLPFIVNYLQDHAHKRKLSMIGK